MVLAVLFANFACTRRLSEVFLLLDKGGESVKASCPFFMQSHFFPIYLRSNTREALNGEEAKLGNRVRAPPREPVSVHDKFLVSISIFALRFTLTFRLRLTCRDGGTLQDWRLVTILYLVPFVFLVLPALEWQRMELFAEPI